MPSRFTKILAIAGVGVLISPLVYFLPAQAGAAMNVNLPYALSSELGVEINPAYPRPNENVSMSLTLYTDDLSSAKITWYKDGQAVLSGKGKINYSFKAGPAGQETRIEIQVSLVSGSSFSKTVTLNPASVDLVWEADSYVPPFYKGKALHPRQGVLKVVATPDFVKNGIRVPASNLVYQWSNGINAYQDQSGYGKNAVLLDGSLLGRDENIKVLVTDPVNNLAAQNFIDITPVDPEIVFYQNDPYYGDLFDSAIINSFGLKSDEVQILAAPYYFTKGDMSLLKYNWQLNGQDITSLLSSMTAIFRKPEGETGQSSVSLRIENPDRILQQADRSLIMDFNN